MLRQFHYSSRTVIPSTCAAPEWNPEIVIVQEPDHGQTMKMPKAQLCRSRSERAVLPLQRTQPCLYFGMEMERVHTTRLAGPKTRFLPFDQGSNGPGSRGKGNQYLDGYSNPTYGEGSARTPLWRYFTSSFI